MLKETEADKTIGFFVTFLSLVAFQLGERGALVPPLATPMPTWRWARVVTSMRSKVNFATTEQ